ncbi:MAG: hypothetical protein LQ345_002168 [Seirophora villosa]|nr:MAG: hypothetical protein LQ345_002168 [Seirophora villosa]
MSRWMENRRERQRSTSALPDAQDTSEPQSDIGDNTDVGRVNHPEDHNTLEPQSDIADYTGVGAASRPEDHNKIEPPSEIGDHTGVGTADQEPEACSDTTPPPASALIRIHFTLILTCTIDLWNVLTSTLPTRYLLTILVAILGLLITAFVPARRPLASFDPRECTYTQASGEHWAIIRMPSGVHYTRYRSISHKLGNADSGPPSSLLAAYSRVNKSVETANRQLVERLACDLKAYSTGQGDDPQREIDLLQSIILVRQQIDVVVSDIALLQSFYASLLGACHQHVSTIMERYKEIRSASTLVEKALAMSRQDLLLWLGVDFAKRHHEKWVETQERSKDVRSDIAALEMQSESLATTKGVVEDIGQSLANLALTLGDGGSSSSGRSLGQWTTRIVSSKGMRDEKFQAPKQARAWVKPWFQQSVAGLTDGEKSFTQRQFDVWWFDSGCWCDARDAEGRSSRSA